MVRFVSVLLAAAAAAQDLVPSMTAEDAFEAAPVEDMVPEHATVPEHMAESPSYPFVHEDYKGSFGSVGGCGGEHDYIVNRGDNTVKVQWYSYGDGKQYGWFDLKPNYKGCATAPGDPIRVCLTYSGHTKCWKNSLNKCVQINDQLASTYITCPKGSATNFTQSEPEDAFEAAPVEDMVPEHATVPEHIAESPSYPLVHEDYKDSFGSVGGCGGEHDYIVNRGDNTVKVQWYSYSDKKQYGWCDLKPNYKTCATAPGDPIRMCLTYSGHTKCWKNSLNKCVQINDQLGSTYITCPKGSATNFTQSEPVDVVV